MTVCQWVPFRTPALSDVTKGIKTLSTAALPHTETVLLSLYLKQVHFSRKRANHQRATGVTQEDR